MVDLRINLDFLNNLENIYYIEYYNGDILHGIPNMKKLYNIIKDNNKKTENYITYNSHKKMILSDDNFYFIDNNYYLDLIEYRDKLYNEMKYIKINFINNLNYIKKIKMVLYPYTNIHYTFKLNNGKLHSMLEPAYISKNDNNIVYRYYIKGKEYPKELWLEKRKIYLRKEKIKKLL